MQNDVQQNSAVNGEPGANGYRNGGLIIGVLFLVLAAGYLLRPISPTVIGTLPADDIREITRIIRQEEKTFTLGLIQQRIEQLPYAISGHGVKRIFTISVTSGGSVEVNSGSAGEWGFEANAYEMRKGPRGWEIVGRGIVMSGIVKPDSLEPIRRL